MEAAGVGLGVISTIDLCVKYGKTLIAICNDFKNADAEVQELLLLIRAVWARIERQVLVLRRTASSLGDEYQYIQSQMLAILQMRLLDLIKIIEKFSKTPSFERKLTYALYRKETLKKSVNDLETWYRRWDPSWFLIARLSDVDVDAEIRHQGTHDSVRRRPISILGNIRDAKRANDDAKCDPFGFLPETLTFCSPSPVRFSPATVSVRSDSQTLAILDNVQYIPGTSETEVSRDIQKLARMLSKLDPITCSLLACSGVRKNMSEGMLVGFSLVFQMPPAARVVSGRILPPRDGKETKIVSSTRSLRDLILNRTPAPSLTSRLIIARSLARSVIFLHSASFVHKNIRPETVLSTDSGASYLVGFTRFRSAAGHTYMLGDTLWHQNLYRHPTRQGMAPEEMYNMYHDVYSLGVCLLEMGLWTSFVRYAFGSNGEEAALPGMHEIAAVPQMRDERKRAFEMKRVLTEVATERLPRCMGDRYCEVVLACLTCLDKGSGFAQSDALSDDNDGVGMGVQYIQKILEKLEDIAF